MSDDAGMPVLTFIPNPSPNGLLVLLLDPQPPLSNENEGCGARCCGSSNSGSEANLIRGFSGVLVVLSIVLVLALSGDGDEEKVSIGTELLEPVEDDEDVLERLEPSEVEDVRAGGEEEGTEEDVVVVGRLLRVRAGALRWREGRRDIFRFVVVRVSFCAGCGRGLLTLIRYSILQIFPSSVYLPGYKARPVASRGQGMWLRVR